MYGGQLNPKFQCTAALNSQHENILSRYRETLVIDERKINRDSTCNLFTGNFEEMRKLMQYLVAIEFHVEGLKADGSPIPELRSSGDLIDIQA